MVVKEFQQHEDIDFTEIFSLVVKLTIIIYALSIMTAKDFHQEQLDVKVVFLHGNLDEDIYMMQPQCYMMPEKEQLI